MNHQDLLLIHRIILTQLELHKSPLFFCRSPLFTGNSDWPLWSFLFKGLSSTSWWRVFFIRWNPCSASNELQSFFVLWSVILLFWISLLSLLSALLFLSLQSKRGHFFLKCYWHWSGGWVGGPLLLKVPGRCQPSVFLHFFLVGAPLFLNLIWLHPPILRTFIVFFKSFWRVGGFPMLMKTRWRLCWFWWGSAANWGGWQPLMLANCWLHWSGGLSCWHWMPSLPQPNSLLTPPPAQQPTAPPKFTLLSLLLTHFDQMHSCS